MNRTARIERATSETKLALGKEDVSLEVLDDENANIRHRHDRPAASARW